MITPDLPFWTRLIIRIAVEAACVVGAALLVERLIRPAFWRRALWQAAVISLLLLTASELSGFGRGLASFLFGHARPEQKIAVWTSPVESTPLPIPSPPPSLPPSFAPDPITVQAAVVKPEIVRPVWWPGLLWLAGGLAVLGRVAAAQILFISLRRRRPVVIQTDLNDRVRAILQRLAFRRKIRLLQSPALAGPIAFGLLRPSVALPVDFAAKFSRAEQDAILAHELAHLAARDPLWYLLADVSSAALWWQPQAWWARHCLHRASELAADEAAALFPQGPAALAECLVILGRQMTQFPAAGRMGVEGGGFRSNLAERVQRLLRLADAARRPSYGWRAHAAKLGAIITISAAAIALSGCLQSRDAEKQPTLQANLSQSWATSPVSTVWHSALPPRKPAPPPLSKPIATLPVKLEMGTSEAAQPASPPIPNAFPATSTTDLAPPATPVHLDIPQKDSVEIRLFVLKNADCNDVAKGLLALFPDPNRPANQQNQNGARGGALKKLVAVNAVPDPRTRSVLVTASKDTMDQIGKIIDELDDDHGTIYIYRRDGTNLSPILVHPAEKFNKAPPQVQIDAKFQPAQQETASLGMGIFHVEPTSFLPIMRHLLPNGVDAPANIMLKRYLEGVGINLTNDGSFTLINPRTGDILARATMRNLDSMAQAIELLNKTPPVDSVDRANELVNKFRTTGSIFLDKQPERVARQTGHEIRVFHVGASTFFQGLQEVFPQVFPRPAGANVATDGLRILTGTNSASRYNSLLTQCFASIGTDLTNNGAAVFFDQRTGDILVRATVRDLETVERVLELLNKAPPQVQIDAKFVLLKQNDAKGIVFQTFLGNSTMSNGPTGADAGKASSATALSGTAPSFTGPHTFANPTGVFPGEGPSGSNPGQLAPAASNGSLTGAALRTVAPNAPISAPSLATLGAVTGIMTDPQFRVFIQAIEQRDGADILSLPRITSLSGRQARVSVTDLVDRSNGVRTTAIRLGSNAPAPANATNTFEEGPVLDVIPTVNADGFTIHLVLNATLREFLGYDMPAQIASQSNAVSSLPTGVPTNAPLPLPRYRVRQVFDSGAVPTNASPPVPRYRNFSRAAAVNVWDGQTVLLGGFMPELDPGQPPSTNTQSENVMVFITATIVDPAGNRVHTDDEMPFAKESVPPQPQGTNAAK
jgi:beta-lactamase regulating signal transducer with metallopeptidase domain/type II secretory pathway component GspD/PulD (secretin)